MAIWELIHRGDCPGLQHFGRYVIEASALEEVLEVLTDPDAPHPHNRPRIESDRYQVRTEIGQ